MENVNSTSEYIKHFYNNQYDSVVKLFTEVERTLQNVMIVCNYIFSKNHRFFPSFLNRCGMEFKQLIKIKQK